MISVKEPALRVEKIKVEVPWMKFLPNCPTIVAVVVAPPVLSCALKARRAAVPVATSLLVRKRASATTPDEVLTTSSLAFGTVVPTPTR